MRTPYETQSDAPLRGKRVLVTRARAASGTLCSRLEALGATVVELPALALEPPPDCAPLDAALRRLSGYDWIAFTSRNAVRAVFDRLGTLGVPDPFPGHLRVAAVGPSTAAELEARGVVAHCVPGEATGASLAAAMAATGIKEAHVLLPLGNLARPELRRGLEAAGAQVDEVVAYHTVRPRDANPSALETLRRGEIDLVALASPSAARNLVEILGADLSPLHRAKLACIGPTTAAAVAELGLKPAGVAAQHTIDGLVQVIVTLAREDVYDPA